MALRSRAATAAFLAELCLEACQAPLLGYSLLSKCIPRWSTFRGSALQLKEYVNPADHLTSHHGLEFFVDYTTGIRSRSFISENPEKRNFRLAYVPQWLAPDGPARDDINQAKLADFGQSYVLIRESDWVEISRRYLVPFHWKNPEDRRPAYIYE
jgi:hypothetical protein